MPNWCQNTFEISAPDQAAYDRLVAAANSQDFFQTLCPVSENGRLFDWGTKWDINLNKEGGFILYKENMSLTCGFLTAWSPPIAFYNHLVSQGYKIKASYCELGMMFGGMYENGTDDYFNIGLENLEALDDDFCESFSLYDIAEDMVA